MLIRNSRRWTSRNQVHSTRRRPEGNLQRRNTFPGPLVRDAYYLRCARQTPKRRFPHRHQGFADGQHNLSCTVKTASRRSAADLQNIGHGLRREGAAVDCERGAQERGGAIQCQSAHHTA